MGHLPEHEADKGRAEEEAEAAGEALDPCDGPPVACPGQQHCQHCVLLPKTAQSPLPEDGPAERVVDRWVGAGPKARLWESQRGKTDGVSSSAWEKVVQRSLISSCTVGRWGLRTPKQTPPSLGKPTRMLLAGAVELLGNAGRCCVGPLLLGRATAGKRNGTSYFAAGLAL